ncbi:MAG: hypothetical protein ACPGGH_01865 [Chitinophagales bacterium]
MKKHFVLLTCLAFALSLLIFQACEKDRLPTVDGTALDYAYACEAVLGPLPEFKYEDAIEIPMTKNGMPLTHGSDNVSDCDQPFAFNAPCDPGNRLGRYQGINPDGTENSDVVFITFFRGSGLGVIGHKLSTGETCFFEIDDFDPVNTPVPQPGDANYNDLWGNPSLISNEFNCTSCHMASPFLHTPAVDQLRNPADASELLVPMTGLAPYSVVGNTWQQPQTTNTIQNSCTSCHRPQCTELFQNYPLDELTMPPPFQNATDFDHNNISDADRQAVRDWCASLNLPQFRF